MPSMADITVKASDGTTDVLYVARTPSAGNGVPAIWSYDSTVAPGFRREFRVTSSDSKDGKQRVIRGTYRFPQVVTDTTTSTSSVWRYGEATCEFKYPKDMSQSAINELSAQMPNLVASALIKSVIASGYAPT